MAKNGPLGTAEKFYIEQKHTQDTIDELAMSLGRTKGSIEAFVNRCKRKTDAQVKAKIKEANKDKTPIRPNVPDEFNVLSEMNVRKGIAIMTQEASMMADEMSKSKNTHTKRADCVTNIKSK